MARQRDEDEGYSDDPPRRKRRDDDEGYSEEQPRRRRRDEDEEDDRPRRRKRDEDEDDYDVRPKRKRREAGRELTGLDATFGNTNVVMLVLFGCLCGDIALLLGIIGLVACTDEKARTNALIVTCVSAVRVVVLVTAIILGNLVK